MDRLIDKDHGKKQNKCKYQVSVRSWLKKSDFSHNGLIYEARLHFKLKMIIYLSSTEIFFFQMDDNDMK